MPTKKYLEELEKSRKKKEEDNKKPRIQTEEEINNMIKEWLEDDRTYEERARDIRKEIEEEQNKNNNTN